MKRENELTIEVELTIKSPVHIGTGNNLVGNEYRIDGEDAEAIDIAQYLNDNPGEVEAVISAMKGEMPIKELPDLDSSYARYSLRSWVDSGPIGDSPVQVALKDETNTPYVPGSSLKGWLRSALAYRMLDSEVKNAGGMAAIADVMEGDDVTERFRVGDNDPKTDLLRCVMVRDAHPVSDPELALCEVKTRRYKSAEDDDPSWMGFSNYAEFILPNWELSDSNKTRFDTEIQVDIGLLERLVESHGGEETAKAVFGDDRTKEGILTTIKEALQQFQRAVIDEEKELLPNFTLPNNSNMISDFYLNKMGEFEGESYDENILFRVGAWTSHYSKTVITRLPDENRIQANVGENLSHVDCGGEITETENDDGETVLVCTEHENDLVIQSPSDEIDRFPKTRRGVYREALNPNENDEDDGMQAYHPFGWIEASFRGPL